MAPASVRARVTVEKSGRRTLIGHRPGEQSCRCAAERRPGGRRARRSRSASSRSTRSASNVSSTEIDFASRSASTGRSSRAYASSARRLRVCLAQTTWPARASRPVQVGDRANADPIAASPASPVPPPGSRRRQRSDPRHLGPGATTTSPSGLSELGGELGHELRRCHADRGGQTTCGRRHRRLEVGTSSRSPGSLSSIGPTRRAEVDEGLVQRQRLHQRGQLPQQAHHLARWPRGRRRSGRSGRRRAGSGGAPRGPASPSGRRTRGPRTTPSPPHHAGPTPPTTTGLAAQRGLVALLDRGEEGVEVEVEHRRLGAHRTILTGGRSGDVRLTP